MKNHIPLLPWLLVLCILVAPATLAAQTVTKNFEKTPLKAVLEEVETQTGCSFLYENSEIEAVPPVTVSFRAAPLRQVLDRVLKPTFSYTVYGNIVTIVRPSGGQTAAPVKSGTVLTGTVISSVDNQTIPGVAVVPDGGKGGTVTDLDGNFTLTVGPEIQQITFSALGYAPKTLSVKDRNLFKLVSLSEESTNLDEAVVVGFGVQKKESMVGAVQAVKPTELNYPSSNLTASFAGRIAGVISVQKSGEPGADGANFWIRGISTFGANTSPLIVMDGVEINATMLNSIAPETIESFSVLKDATATALYGSRGANGVLIITTKNGKDSEKMSVNVRVENGWSMPTSVQKIADAVTYMEAFNEAVGMDYYSQEKIDGTRNHLDPYLYPDVDWYGTLFKRSTMNQNVNANVTGGGKRVDYFFNATVFNENGILNSSNAADFNTNLNYRKFLFQSNISARITPTTKLGIRMNTQLHYRHGPYENVGNLFYYTMRCNPALFPVTWPAEEGDTFVRYGSTESPNGAANEVNPYALMSRGYGDRHYSYFTETVNLDQDLKFITEGLRFKAQASFYNYVYAASYKYTVPHYYKLLGTQTDPQSGAVSYVTSPIGNTPQDYYSISTGRDGYREMSLQSSVEYTRTFAESHDVNALLVYHQKEKVLNTPDASENSVLPYREQGLAGRLTYSWKNRYLMEANFGYNGSENFAVGRRFGFFPSVAVGWNISNEPFFRPLADAVSLLKVRFSYGQSGNDALNVRFPYVTEVNTNAAIKWYIGKEFTPIKGTTVATLGNADATWEVSTKANLGLELGLARALTVIVDLFDEDRDGIFMQRLSVPATTGYANTLPYANIGRVHNRGLDASMEYNKAFGRDLSLSARATLTYAHNEVVERDEPAGMPAYQSMIGYPIDSVKGLVADGLFRDEDEIAHAPVQTYQAVRPGDIKYVDLNGDGQIDDDDMTVIGRPTTPELVYGFGASVVWKKFDASFFFQGQGLVSILMSDMHPFCDKGVSGFGMTRWIADGHWSEDHPDTGAVYPRLSTDWNQNNTKISSYWMRDGSFLRLKTVELGYSFKWFRVYVSGSNLATFSGFKYWDPGLGSGNGLSYPLQRTYNIGLQYNF